MLAGATSSFPLEYRFALEFDLSSIPSGATINSATPYLDRKAGGAGAGGDSTINIWIHGYPSDGSITLGDVSISNPIAGPFVESFVSGSFVFTDISADVTALRCLQPEIPRKVVMMGRSRTSKTA